MAQGIRMSAASILMVEDERGLVVSVGDRLRREGYEFISAPDGKTGLEIGLQGNYDLALIDVGLPGLNGFDLVREFRKAGIEQPILFLTARDQTDDKINGLRIGADDYIPKPFIMDELLARIEANLRRAPARGPDPHSFSGLSWLDTSRDAMNFGTFVLDFKSAGLFRSGSRIDLSNQEFRLLCVLAEHRGEALGADRLLNLAWGYESDVTSRTLYVHIAWLRAKLRDPGNPDGYIRTIRGIGYMFDA